MSKSIREKAVVLRLNGWSYKDITERLGVAKSTQSYWFRDMPYTPNSTVVKRIKNGPAKANMVKCKQKLANIVKAHSEAEKEVGKISERDLFMVGIGLYLGEGSKKYEQACIINSDPEIIRLAMKWFREICRLNNNNFRVKVHIYPDNNEKEVLRYWSEITQLPLTNFNKTQVDTRINKSRFKRRTLPYGTAHIVVKANGQPEKGVYLHRKIVGWMKAVHNNVRV